MLKTSAREKNRYHEGRGGREGHQGDNNFNRTPRTLRQRQGWHTGEPAVRTPRTDLLRFFDALIVMLRDLCVLCGKAFPFLRVLGALRGEAFLFLRVLGVLCGKAFLFLRVLCGEAFLFLRGLCVLRGKAFLFLRGLGDLGGKALARHGVQTRAGGFSVGAGDCADAGALSRRPKGSAASIVPMSPVSSPPSSTVSRP